MLVSQDIRERTGAFFTPKIWVQKSQEYLAKALGEDWQDEYYIWDCAGGTGNLLAGLTNHRNVFCSTLDHADVKVVKQRNQMVREIFEDHIFQFDFLNDEFFDKVDEKGNVIVESKVPKKLQEILRDEKKRQKLVIYINPPYAEASTTSTRNGTGQNKTAVADTRIAKKYWDELGGVRKELYAQFFMRIYQEISCCILASFSTLKYINAQQSQDFRKIFKAKFLNGFMSPSYTFDNVNGKFPIGFLVWDTHKKEKIDEIRLDVFDEFNHYLESKIFRADSTEQKHTMVQWLRNFYDKKSDCLALLRMIGSDFQNNQGVFFANKLTDNDIKKRLFTQITSQNIIPMSMYLAIRHAISATWINDRDQFYAPQ